MGIHQFNRKVGALTLALCVSPLLVGACDRTTPLETEDVAGLPVSADAGGTAKSEADVFLMPPPPNGPAVGRSRIKRNGDRITVQFRTSAVEAGHAVTIWTIVFNKPELCGADGCTGADISADTDGDGQPDNPVMGDVMRLTGRVVGGGEAQFSGQIREGDASESIRTGLGLMDAMKAEVHFIVRTHGPAIPGLVDEQIHTASGGCNINACADIAFAIHPAPGL